MPRHLPLLALALSALLMSACNLTRYYLDSGRYDDAINVCLQKLQGKKNKKTEYVRALEIAFKKATDEDMRTINNLIAEDRPENWAMVNAIHRGIITRQNKIEPLLPLVSKDGYKAHFNFVNIEKLERQSREKAADYLYDCAEEYLVQARRGDRQAARNAYAKLRDLENDYFQNYRNVNAMKREARELGTTHVLFEVKNASTQILPGDFFDHVMDFGTSDLNSEWKQYHLKAEPGAYYDYRVRFNVESVDVSPERVQERAYTDEKEIQDGWNYQLDRRGNVMKDSLGNDIKTPRMVRIRADIMEVYQTKAVRITGTLVIFDAQGINRLNSQDLNTEVLFENYASTFRGDERALSEQSRRRIGNRPLPFPPTQNMLIQAADNLKPIVHDRLRDNRAML